MWNGKNINVNSNEILKNKVCVNCGSKHRLKSDLILLGNGINNWCYCVECVDLEEVEKIRHKLMYGEFKNK